MSKIDALEFAMRCQNWREVAFLIARHQKPQAIMLRNGTRFVGDALHWWDINDIFFKHVYTPPRLHIGVDDVIVDIGANIGAFTVYAASQTRNTIYAYEPSTTTFTWLEKNVRENALATVRTCNAAVADKRGVESFIDNEDGTSSKLERIKPENGKKHIQVETTTLQDIMDENALDCIHFLKMDCEGSEGLILRSAPTSYLKRVRKIAMEFHDGISVLKHQEMQALLADAGFYTGVHWDGKSRLGHLYAWRA